MSTCLAKELARVGYGMDDETPLPGALDGKGGSQRPTVRQVLAHASGWGDVPAEFLGAESPTSLPSVIGAPGEIYSYNNYAYGYLMDLSRRSGGHTSVSGVLGHHLPGIAEVAGGGSACTGPGGAGPYLEASLGLVSSASQLGELVGWYLGQYAVAGGRDAPGDAAFEAEVSSGVHMARTSTWYVSECYGTRLYQHGGAGQGFPDTFLAFAPRADLGLVVIANGGKAKTFKIRVMEELLAEATGIAPCRAVTASERGCEQATLDLAEGAGLYSDGYRCLELRKVGASVELIRDPAASDGRSATLLSAAGPDRFIEPVDELSAFAPHYAHELLRDRHHQIWAIRYHEQVYVRTVTPTGAAPVRRRN
jgi:hypothetical protein